MNIKKPDRDEMLNEITCPNCNAEINIDELGLVMFKSCTIFSCPICKKTIAIQPKGKEFSVELRDNEEIE